MKKKAIKVKFTAPDLSEKELILFLHFRLTSALAQLTAIKEILTPKISEEEREQLSKLTEFHLNQANDIYEQEAEAFCKYAQKIKRPWQN